MLRQTAFAFAALTAVAIASEPALAQDRFALVIGNSKYRNASELANPSRDAAAIGALLKDAGFQVTSALDLDKASMSKVVRFFTTSIAEKPESTVALIYFAGHGLQVDGENFLVPVDAAIAREADVPLEAMRMGDLMSMLETVRARTRIVILDACRDNPFGDIAKIAPRGLSLVNAPAGTLIAYSTSPGHTADDGTGIHSPFAQALLKSAREPGLPIETALKNVRLSVHGATGGRQTPWEVSALTEPFSFFPGDGALKRPPSSDRSADEWRKQLQGMPARDAFAIAVREDDVLVYEQYLALYGGDPLAVNLRAIFDRRLMMLAWQEAVALNSAAAFAAFLARYPNSDLSETARRLQQRAQNRQINASVLGGGRDANLIQAAAPAGSCPCALPGTPNRPLNPGAPPPGTRASVPGPVAPVPPGGPVFVPTDPDPVFVPGGTVVVPVIPPRIREPVRIRDPKRDNPRPGDRDTGKGDHARPNDSRNDRPSGGRGDRKPDKVVTPKPLGKGDRDIRRERDRPRSLERGGRGRDVNRNRQIEPRAGQRQRGGGFERNASPRFSPRPNFQAGPPRGGRGGQNFQAPRGGRDFGRGGGAGLRLR
ncbi:caspase domain-containing protein [Pseudorhodoplanes sp.]|uniref:caspase family protein n=1 Tax=Pseudorhodoplanes sp. TaxID=1934341 RepID=UPI0039197CA7